MNLRERIQTRVLPRVQAPGQYVGCELNAVSKDHASVEATFCLCFPDTYAVGMSQTGLHILYEVLNRREDTAAERCFAPWPDMADALREEGLPLCSLETCTPLGQFDILGFSLQYEMCYTNVLEMLDLGGVPLRSEDRGLGDPLVAAGGPCAFNPEPMADFVDVFLPGDGEESIGKLVEASKALRPAAQDRRELLLGLARQVEGAYCPALYAREYPRRPLAQGVPETVAASVVRDLDAAPYPVRPILPFQEIVHDRITLEIMRGCARGCRFCQAGMTRRPVRLRSKESLCRIAEESYKATGHSEISLASLSSSDYPDLGALAKELTRRFKRKGVNLALSSLRVNDQLSALPEMIAAVRKSGLTIAPEAATERLRHVINKDITDRDLLEGVAAAFQRGWRRVKLYFMCGLPTETDEDVAATVGLAERVAWLGKEVAGRWADVSLNVAPFVPKPHTPFQWEPMISLERMKEIRDILFQRRRRKSVKIKFHLPERSLLEGAFSRGDLRLGKVVEEAWRRGCRFDAWDELFRFSVWTEAFEACGMSAAECAGRPRGLDEPLPWAHISAGLSERFLRREKGLAESAQTTPYCRDGRCAQCGVPFCAWRDGGGDGDSRG